jgi:exodeoxyribonuclease VII small subunit
MGKKKSQSAEESDPNSPESFEAAMDELGQIVSKLESGQESLDDSLRQYERGMALLRNCHQRLDAAAQRIEIVSRVTADGEILTTPFDSTSTLNRSRAAAESDSDESSESGSLF